MPIHPIPARGRDLELLAVGFDDCGNSGETETCKNLDKLGAFLPSSLYFGLFQIVLHGVG